MAQRHIDIVNKQFGKWLVIGHSRTESRVSYWNCKCIKCGYLKEIRRECLRDKITTKSNRCNHKPHEKLSTRINDTNWLVNRATSELYTNYKAQADIRKYEWKLTYEEAALLFQMPCFYCSDPPSQIKKLYKQPDKQFLYNGIDRKDNTLGYTNGNCVSCCVTCNKGKSTLTYSDWIRYLERVARNFAQIHS